MPLQFLWLELGTDFFEFDAGRRYDRSYPACLGYVFSQIQATVQYYAKVFLVDADRFVFDLQLRGLVKLKKI